MEQASSRGGVSRKSVAREDIYVRTSSPEEGLRVLEERYYKEHIVHSVACRGDRWGPNQSTTQRN